MLSKYTHTHTRTTQSNATHFVSLMSQNKENKLFAHWGVKEWALSGRKREKKKQSKIERRRERKMEMERGNVRGRERQRDRREKRQTETDISSRN